MVDLWRARCLHSAHLTGKLPHTLLNRGLAHLLLYEELSLNDVGFQRGHYDKIPRYRAQKVAMMDASNDRQSDLFAKIKTLIERRLAFDQKLRGRVEQQEGTQNRIGTSSNNYSRIGESDGILSVQGRVSYLKLKGDQLLHVAERAHLRQNSGKSILPGAINNSEVQNLASQALTAYLSARQAASGVTRGSHTDFDYDDLKPGDTHHGETSLGKGPEGHPSLHELHPLRLELAWRISSVLLHLLDRPVEAWEAAYPTFKTASEHPARLQQSGLYMTELLRDHLALIDTRSAGPGHGYQQQGQGGPDTVNEIQDIKEGWGFLRLNQEARGSGDASSHRGGGVGSLSISAQVRHARACMDGVAKVLLETMVAANTVRLALETVRDLF